MKLRHEKFGSYPGTCWRLLFIFALMPWMRKYRLNRDNIDVSSFRFAAMRMWSGRMPKDVPINATIDGESFELKQSNSELQKEIAKLKRDHDMLRQEMIVLKQSNSELQKEIDKLLYVPSRNKKFSMSLPNTMNTQ